MEVDASVSVLCVYSKYIKDNFIWLEHEELLFLKILIATEKIVAFLRRKSSPGKFNQEEIKPSKLCLRKQEKNEKKTT